MFTDIEKIIPHRDPMIMIDGYERINEDQAAATKYFPKDSYGVHNGIVLSSILVECVAQTVAAHFGHKRLSDHRQEPETGMLVSVDSFEFKAQVPAQATIRIHIEKAHQIGEFRVYTGEISMDRLSVAEGQIKLFAAGGSE